MNSNPVLVILNGLAVVVAATLAATNALGVTHLDPAQGAAVVAAVTAWCNLLGFSIRAAVVPVAVHEQAVAAALATPPPGTATVPAPQPVAQPVAPAPLPADITAAIDAQVTRQAAGA
jgi:hypothetical protein